MTVPRPTRALFAAALILLAASGCERSETGAVTVTVIGTAPKLVDPSSGTLDPPEAVLLENAAQGLVRFDRQGNIEAGLAERWNVSNDGLSYIFRLRSGEWPSGRKISAFDVARILRRQLADRSRNSLKDTFGAVAQVVGMTDRVLAIELRAPRPHLLQLLAQPEFALVREGQGSGPFAVGDPLEGGSLLLTRELAGTDAQAEAARERVHLQAATAEAAVRAFKQGTTDLVLGGDFANLSLAIGGNTLRGTLRFDPVAGLFGLVPARRTGLAGDPEIRSLLDRSIDRLALVAALGVPDLEARATILQPGLDGGVTPAAPPWTAIPLPDRRPTLLAEARRLFATKEGETAPTIRIALPDGPGAAIMLARLRSDWTPLRLTVELAGKGRPADFRLIDAVAPSVSPAWFLRAFRCGEAPVCSKEIDELLDAARVVPVAAQRSALLAEAERRMREEVLFIPIAAPVRWSLVARGIPGFVENRFGRHPLSDLRN
ncbi:MAG TPA: ABC transporter substrate-binding protein [Sphingomicrobium sp.]|jgi:peptide/nickel transport system substrate-binding protein|nr:ABC transporter substrate-binding protein [Sphingomicrobium sp.]